jgi:hypothetical protein
MKPLMHDILIAQELSHLERLMPHLGGSVKMATLAGRDAADLITRAYDEIAQLPLAID